MCVYVDKMSHANKKLFLSSEFYLFKIYIEHYHGVEAKSVTTLLNFLICNGYHIPLNSIIRINALDIKA